MMSRNVNIYFEVLLQPDVIAQFWDDSLHWFSVNNQKLKPEGVWWYGIGSDESMLVVSYDKSDISREGIESWLRSLGFQVRAIVP